jgi:hypothetical protein
MFDSFGCKTFHCSDALPPHHYAASNVRYGLVLLITPVTQAYIAFFLSQTAAFVQSSINLGVMLHPLPPLGLAYLVQLSTSASERCTLSLRKQTFNSHSVLTLSLHWNVPL